MEGTTGERIRYLRDCKGLTQEQFARAVHTTKDTIKKLETGQRGITIQTLNAVADYFDVSTDFLLGRTDVAYADARIKTIARIVGLSDQATLNLMIESGAIKGEEVEPSEYAEEMQEFLNLLIPQMPYSYLIREFSNLLDIYKSNTQFEFNDTKGSWIEIDGDLQNTVTMRSGEAVEFLFYQIASEITEMLKEAMTRKYGNHTPEEKEDPVYRITPKMLKKAMARMYDNHTQEGEDGYAPKDNP